MTQPPRISLSSEAHELIDHLDQQHAAYLNPVYQPDPSLWTQAKCDRFNTGVDTLLLLLKEELDVEFLILDKQTRYREDPYLREFLAANPDQKPIG